MAGFFLSFFAVSNFFAPGSLVGPCSSLGDPQPAAFSSQPELGCLPWGTLSDALTLTRPLPSGQRVGYARFTSLPLAQQAIAALHDQPLDEELAAPVKAFLSFLQLGDDVGSPLHGWAWGRARPPTPPSATPAVF